MSRTSIEVLFCYAQKYKNGGLTRGISHYYQDCSRETY